MFTRWIQRACGPCDPDRIRALAAETGLSVPVASVLAARGIDDAASAAKFLHPTLDDLHDPFAMPGMDVLTERLREAIEGAETVVVYGDYDADGICATAILTRYLVSKGVNVVPYIPSRKSDGYGITLAALERLIDETFPDLILTCDCGISARAEIEAIRDSGVDLIVTDHHEPPETLPDCVCLDPKIKDCGYPFDGLCGAGVALKVVEAMEGREGIALYLDLAAVATVADLVPLADENRAIVTEGLKRINAGLACRGLQALLEGMTAVTATDLAYRVAPRINAAGRMGDAYRAFRLLVGDSPAENAELLASIDADNARRKELCAAVYRQACELIRRNPIANSVCLVLGHPDWEKGLTSIVAAQIAGEFKRPTFLVVRNGDSMKGTARSVEGVNIHAVLKACSDLLIEYGGHAQAAGFSIAEENVEAFRTRADEYLRAHFPPETFLPSAYYDATLSDKEMTFALAKELDKLEPYGNGNPRPVFLVSAERPSVEPMKGKPAHLVIKLGKTNVNAFNFGKCCSILRGEGRYELGIELSVNRFQGREYLSAILRDFDFDVFRGSAALESFCDVSPLFALARYDDRRETIPIEGPEILSILREPQRRGTLFVAYRKETYDRFVSEFSESRDLWHSLYTRETSGNFNRIVLAPTPEFDACGYHRIVMLDCGFDRSLLPFSIDPGAVVRVAGEEDATVLDEVSARRDVFVKLFCAFRGGARGTDLYSALDGCRKELTLRQAAACYAVFRSLGLASYDRDKGEITADNSRKRDLADSAGYRRLTEKSV